MSFFASNSWVGKLPRLLTRESRRKFRTRHWLRVEKVASILASGRHSAIVEAACGLGSKLASWSSHLRVVRAVAAGQDGRHAESADHWAVLTQRLPGLPMPYCRSASAYRLAGRIDLASDIVRRAFDALPQELWSIEDMATVGDLADDAMSEASRSADGCGSRTDEVVFAAQASLLLGRVIEAEGLVRQALDIDGERPDLLALEATFAERRRDWSKVVSSWTAYLSRVPEDKDAIARLDAARDNAAAGGDAARPADPLSDDLRSLFFRFRSLGDNCEFGLVQRHFGAEPSGFLRWNVIALPNLLAAFEAGFEGVGDREHTYVDAAKSGEFFVHDRRWDLAMHTFHRKEQIDPSVLLERMCQRAVYLRSKFFADLASADLTFVFRSNDVSESDALTLQRAMQRHGAGRLMVVRPVRPGEVPCELRVLDRHCYYGLTSRRGDDPDAQTWDIPFKDWLVLCRQAASLNDPRTAIAR